MLQVPEYDSFKNRWEIKGTLILETPLHIGAGQCDEAQEQKQSTILIWKDSLGRELPYIPGSSLKGVLRSNLERLLRTFSENGCCLSVNGEEREPCCGTCVVCQMFGSPEGGSSITVRDAHVSEEWLNTWTQQHPVSQIKAEQMHCATKYDVNLNPIMSTTGTVETGAWPQERVAVGTEFSFSITLDNADDIHVGYLLLALDEFNKRRAFLGSGTSRGLGVISVTPFPPKITRTILDPNTFSMKTESPDRQKIQEIMHDAKEELRKLSVAEHNDTHSDKADFSIYSHSRDANPANGTPPSGCVVAELEVVPDNESFRMPGINEKTVTSGGIPYIPGSTIKGFLRHTFIDQKNKISPADKAAIKSAVKWIYRTFGEIIEEVKEISGERTIQEKPVQWSHLLVSDAFPCIPVSNGNGGVPEEIPANTPLHMWCVFNNMESEDIQKIMGVLTNPAGVTITGNTVATNDAPRHHNKVKISLKIPPGYQAFRIQGYLNAGDREGSWNKRSTSS